LKRDGFGSGRTTVGDESMVGDVLEKEKREGEEIRAQYNESFSLLTSPPSSTHLVPDCIKNKGDGVERIDPEKLEGEGKRE
jgi:hypothetical protein